LPVGLLRDGRFRLDPLPPPEQQAAIGRLGYGAGVLGKIYLRFPHQFWPDKSKWFGRLPDAPDRRGTFNTFVSHVEETGLPILLSFANGHSAVRYDRELDDEAVKQVALDSLRKMFGHNKVPEPEAFVFPRWLSDPWTMGGYSYPAIGSPPEDHYDHARPLGNRVFFAGEATEPVEYGTVHAALWSAEQTAEALFRAATGADAAREMRPWAGARRGAGRHNG
jgi:monoamine oxidase